MQDYAVVNVVRELIANNVLVVVTGCAAITSGKHGLLTPETMEFAGESLAEVCETIGIPPVLHMGSCVDNSRILTVLADVAATGGLGDDIAGLPAVALSPEWFSEKALEIATYAVGSGAHVIFGGVGSPVANSPEVDGLHDRRLDRALRRLAALHQGAAGHGHGDARSDRRRPQGTQDRHRRRSACSSTWT